MAYIIGKSHNLKGLHEVTDHLVVKSDRFKKELEETIKSVYPEDSHEHKKMVEIITTAAQDGLNKFRSVHIGGKYFFSSKSNSKDILKYIQK